MKNKTILLEQVKVSDSEKKMGPKGVIRISDEKGNLLIQTENLITKAGREVIMKSLLAKVGVEEDTSNYQLMLFLGKANSVNPTADDKITDVISNIENVGIGKLNVDGGLFNLYTTTTKPQDSAEKVGIISISHFDESSTNEDIKIQVDINLNEGDLEKDLKKFAIGEIGFVLKTVGSGATEPAGETETISRDNLVLFSHATFNAIPITSNSSQKISYYIYF